MLHFVKRKRSREPLITKSEQAEQDLLEIYTYIGQDNLRAADRVIDAAEAAFSRLAQFPGLGRLWNAETEKLDGIRCWPIPRFQTYLIFYRPLPKGIEVLRVLHPRRNLNDLLED